MRKGQQERFSELQKFILKAAYLKTHKQISLPKRTYSLSLSQLNNSAWAERYNELTEEIYFSALYESDILLNFYGLNEIPGTGDRYSGGSNKEKTALRRSLETLYKRGYIREYWQYSTGAGNTETGAGFTGKPSTLYERNYHSRAIITLTLKGEMQAEKFLKVG